MTLPRNSAAEFSLNGDEIAYVFPSDAGLACIGVSAPRDDFGAFRAAPDAELLSREGNPFWVKNPTLAHIKKLLFGTPDNHWSIVGTDERLDVETARLNELSTQLVAVPDAPHRGNEPDGDAFPA